VNELQSELLEIRVAFKADNSSCINNSFSYCNLIERIIGQEELTKRALYSKNERKHFAF
jgi:hypothetical protein